MKTFWLLIVGLFCFSATADAQVIIKRKGVNNSGKVVIEEEEIEAGPLIGKWLEYKRTIGDGRKSKEIDFTDTLKLNFLGDSTVYNYLPKAKVTRERYGFVGEDFYFEEDKTMHSLLLKNDILKIEGHDFVSHLKKVDEFYFQRIEKVVPDEATGEIETINENFLIGNWKVYKKKDPDFDRKNIYFYKVNVTKKNDDGSYAIEAYYNNADKLINDKGTLVVEDNKFIMNIMNQTVTYTITKAVGNELILMDDDIIYFISK
jgi:hypothetical protein